jgi:hypothetical protein
MNWVRKGVLVELLDKLKEEGHRTLVFSQSRKLLDIAIFFYHINNRIITFVYIFNLIDSTLVGYLRF